MKKLILVLSIVLLVVSCKDEPMNTETNQLAGVWATSYIQSNKIYASYVQFRDNGTFVYTSQYIGDIFGQQPETQEIKQYKGNYTYNDFTIVFEITDPELSVTHSTYHITDGNKLYCKGEKLLYTENLHTKQVLRN